MKMTMTNVEVKGLIDCLNNLTAAKINLSPTTWYNLAGNRKILLDLDKVTEETRLDLVKKFGKKDENDVFNVPEEKMSAFTKAYNELLHIEVEVNLTQLTMKDLEKDTKGKGLAGVDNMFLFFDYMIKKEAKMKAEK